MHNESPLTQEICKYIFDADHKTDERILEAPLFAKKAKPLWTQVLLLQEITMKSHRLDWEVSGKSVPYHCLENYMVVDHNSKSSPS